MAFLRKKNYFFKSRDKKLRFSCICVLLTVIHSIYMYMYLNLSILFQIVLTYTNKFKKTAQQQ